MMFKLSSVWLLLLLLTKVQTVPQNDQPDSLISARLGEVYEDDMILNNEQQQRLRDLENPGKNMKRTGWIDTKAQWPNKTVLYRLTDNFTHDEVDLFEKAMFHIADLTCVKFQNAPASATAYVKIIKYNDWVCRAHVGYQGHVQYLSARADCMNIGSILHELLHVLGFYHQHTASDRDLYIRIHLENVEEGMQLFFKKFPAGFFSDYGIGYDYDSVLHYGRKAFSINGLDTIVPLQPGVILGAYADKLGLSIKDRKKIRKMYECDLDNEN